MCKNRHHQEIDSLTKLWTKDAAKRLIEDYQQEGQKYEGDVIYLIYLEGWLEFKADSNVNPGSSALQQIAFLLGKLFGKPNVTARISENAFLVYELGCRTVEEASYRAEKLWKKLQGIPFFRERKGEVNVRIGAVWCHGEIKEYDVLLKGTQYAVKCAINQGQFFRIIKEKEFKQQTDMDLPELKAVTSYDTLNGQADIEFITELTDTLFLCEDAAIGIEISLERLCRYFQVERATVMELSPDRKYFEMTYKYHVGNIRVINENLHYIPAYFIRAYANGFDKNGICLCNCLADLEKVSRIVAEHEKIYGTRALMQIAIREEGVFAGYIGIFDEKAERLWTRKEIITYLMAGKIITASILRMRSLKYTLRAAYSDLLTESWNKNKFLIETEKSPKRAGWKKAVVTFDIKNFKAINLEFSYTIGNEVLIEISNLLGLFIEKDECYARLEADTFVVLLYYREQMELERRVQQLLNHVEHLSARLELMFSFVCKAGICMEEEIPLDIQEMIDCAEMIRKSIKDYHKSSYGFFNRDSQRRRDREKYITARMKNALENEEFLIYYQPRVDVRSGEYLSLEALARWQPTGEDMIMPGDFIPVFEQNGFISELDLYVFEHVCKEMQKWMQEGKKVYPVAVNISRVHIREKDLMEQLEAVCHKYCVPVKYIELEITESAFLDSPEIVMESAAKIKEKGFRLSMDDFGTGFSSLSMLKDIPVDILKLDKEFFQNKMTGREKIIISHVIEMARELQIEVVSEGIETLEHEQFLIEIGCDVAQGFLYARPQPIQEHEAKLWK